jgi:2-polyprenyl-6-methoxyphenol hydroxylase-like FAD-dependent oxidoreductase
METYKLAREIPVDKGYDVVGAGGGPGGSAAAICAARLGVRVLLIEATGAVQSIQTGQTACDLDSARLVEVLRAQRANLPQSELSKTMTRSV